MIKLFITHPLKHFTLESQIDVKSSGITSIFGQSGSGKTTLLNIIAGKIKPKIGYISINNRVLIDTNNKFNLPPHQRHIGYVFQEGNLFPHYSVKGNLQYGMCNKSQEKLDEISELLDITPLLNNRVLHLSGGEKQRVAIGRALLCNPQLLLMDEPLTSLDSQRKEEVLAYLEKIVKYHKMPILLVTHDKSEVKRLSNQYIEIIQGNASLKSIHTLY